jgi:hypothetical protein
MIEENLSREFESGVSEDLTGIRMKKFAQALTQVVKSMSRKSETKCRLCSRGFLSEVIGSHLSISQESLWFPNRCSRNCSGKSTLEL